MWRQDAVSHSSVTRHSKAKNPIFPSLPTLLLHPNLKLARSKARPVVGFFEGMESFLISLSNEVSGRKEAQGSAECQEEWPPSHWSIYPKKKPPLEWFSKGGAFLVDTLKEKIKKARHNTLIWLLFQPPSNMFKDNYDLGLPFCPFSAIGAWKLNVDL